MSHPLSRPQSVPDTTAATRPIPITPQPAGPALPPLTHSMVFPHIMPEKISTEPTDRSMPEVMITKVIPTDSTSSTDVSISKVWKVNRVANWPGASTVNTMINASSTSAIQNVLAATSRRPSVRVPNPPSTEDWTLVFTVTEPPPG